MSTTYLEAGQQLAVTADASSSGTLTRLTDLPGAGLPLTSVSIAAGTTTRVGPFSTTTRWEVTSAAGAITFSVGLPATEADLNPAGLVTSGAPAGTGVSAAEYSGLHHTILTLASLSVTMTDAGAAGCHGTQKVYDWPAGPIQILGSSFDLTLLAGAGGIADGAAVVGSLGTAAVGTDNATLTTTEANLIASAAGTLTAGAGTLKKHGSLVAAAFDGTSTAVDAHLNLAVPDADSSANDTLTISGTIHLFWLNLGDY